MFTYLKLSESCSIVDHICNDKGKYCIQDFSFLFLSKILSQVYNADRMKVDTINDNLFQDLCSHYINFEEVTRFCFYCSISTAFAINTLEMRRKVK